MKELRSGVKEGGKEERGESRVREVRVRRRRGGEKEKVRKMTLLMSAAVH